MALTEPAVESVDSGEADAEADADGSNEALPHPLAATEPLPRSLYDGAGVKVTNEEGECGVLADKAADVVAATVCEAHSEREGSGVMEAVAEAQGHGEAEGEGEGDQE